MRKVQPIQGRLGRCGRQGYAQFSERYERLLYHASLSVHVSHGYFHDKKKAVSCCEHRDPRAGKAFILGP